MGARPEGLVNVLLDRPPIPRPAAPPVARWEWLAFFEAYFSNFIERTEFGVDEARRIAIDGVIPQSRPQETRTTSWRPTVSQPTPPIERGHPEPAKSSSFSYASGMRS